MAVTLEDIAVELGRATPLADSIEAKQWQRWIDRAAALIEGRANRLGVDPATLDVAVVDDVVVRAVARHARRPDNAMQVSVSVDDGSTQRTYQSSAGEVTIADGWWDELGLVGVSGAFSTRPGFVSDAGVEL